MNKYKPQDLLFVVSPETEDFPATVSFTTKECWENEGCQSDDLGGHNMPSKELLKCGVFDSELAESIFETTGEFEIDEVKEKLLAAGFCEDEGFTNFMLNQNQTEI